MRVKTRANQPKLYCSPVMREMFAHEQKTPYLKTEDLRVEEILGGIVHPLHNSVSPADSAGMYGGVTDSSLNFIPLSLTKRVSPPNFFCKQEDWFCGANHGSKPPFPYCDQDVVFIGALPDHYGHFILEGLARLWPFLEAGKRNLTAVYISESPNLKFLDFFSLFGLNPDQLLRIESPTKFRMVIVPEQSVRLHDFYHPLYKDTVDKIKGSVKPKGPSKIFFSKKMGKSNRAVGESVIESVFAGAGYSIIYPEGMDALETVSTLSGCTEFVASSGTNIHNSIFLPDEAKIVCINRSAHFHPIQSMIDQMKRLETTYIDAYIWSSIVNFGDSPCFLAPTRYLFQYFDNKNFSYRKFDLIKSLPMGLLYHLRAKIRWNSRRCLRFLYRKLLLSDIKFFNVIAYKIRLFYS
jgi:hypothetical protein